MFVPAIDSTNLAWQIGDKRSRDLLLRARLFGAEEAYRRGLVDEIVASDHLAQRVEALAQPLAEDSSESLAATKLPMAAQNKPWLKAAIAEDMEANAQAPEIADFREGVAAFLEKRKPAWAKRK